MEQEELYKSLVSLIDETIAEIEDLKKSDRFSAQEINLGDEKANGSINKAESEDEDEDKKDEEKFADKDHKHDIECKVKKSEDEEDEDEEDEDEEDEVKKAEKAYDEAVKKAEMCKAELEEKKMKKCGDVTPVKVAKTAKLDEEALAKSIDARVQPLETKMSEVLDLIKKMADTPVPRSGVSGRTLQPLAKSNVEEKLSKSQVIDALVELKKTGKQVDAADAYLVEHGSADDYARVVNKYGIK